MLRRVARFFEGQEFEVAGVHEVAPRLLAPPGAFSVVSPDATAMEDIRLGFRVARALGSLDIGQGAVVARQYVLAVEAALADRRQAMWAFQLEECIEAWLAFTSVPNSKLN